MRDACHFVSGIFATLTVMIFVDGGSTSTAAIFTVAAIVAWAIPRIGGK